MKKISVIAILLVTLITLLGSGYVQAANEILLNNIQENLKSEENNIQENNQSNTTNSTENNEDDILESEDENQNIQSNNNSIENQIHK